MPCSTQTLGGKASFTAGTGKGAHSLVAEVVRGQLRPLAEGAATYVTEMRILVTVDEHMCLEDP